MLLTNKVTVVVPSTIGSDAAPADIVTGAVEYALANLARVAGGSTAVNATGAWIDSKGHIVREQVCNVYAYCTDAQLEWVVMAAKRVATETKEYMNQESVAIITNGTMEFI